MSYLFTYFAFLLVDSLYLCQFITCLFLNKVWGDLIVFHNLLRTSFHPEHCGAKNPGLIMAYIAATLNPEILKNFPGPVRVGKKKSGSGRVAGTRQGLLINLDDLALKYIIKVNEGKGVAPQHRFAWPA